MKPSRISLIILLALCTALFFAPAAQAYLGNQTSPSLAPAGRPHSVNFATSGLADGVPITISGNRTNNGGNSVPFILTFTSPGPSSAITAQPGSDIIYFNGYPDQYVLGDTIFTLIDITPTSPFTAGLSGETTTVLGVYTSCTLPIFTSQPISTTVSIGKSISFSVSIANPASASYQWYKDNLEINGANESTYTIDAAEFNDGGTYHVVVSNLCGSVQSDPAVLTVSKLSQTINFTPPPSPAAFNTSFTVSPTATSGLTVTLQASGGCLLAGNQVTMTSSSLDCTLTASQPGNDDYLPADDVQHVVTAAKASQTIDFTPPNSPAGFGTSFTVSPTATSGLTVTLQASGGCQIAGNQVTMTSGSLDCTLTASQPGNDDYLPANDVQYVVAAAKASQIIDFTPPPSPAALGTSFTVSPTTSSGLVVSLIASGSCTSTRYLVTMTQSSGICTLTASQPGNENYSQAEPVMHTVQAVEAVYLIFLPVIGQ